MTTTATSTPATLLAPARLAYPQYAGLLNALAALMAGDPSGASLTPPAVPALAAGAASTVHGAAVAPSAQATTGAVAPTPAALESGTTASPGAQGTSAVPPTVSPAPGGATATAPSAHGPPPATLSTAAKPASSASSGSAESPGHSAALPSPATVAAPVGSVSAASSTTPAHVVPPATSTPAAAVDPAPTFPTALTVYAGAAAAIDGGGLLCSFDFGDRAGEFNLLRGYNAAHVYDTPGDYVATITPDGHPAATTAVTVVADTRPQVQLTATEDLAQALAPLKQPTIVLLPAGAAYDVKTPITISVDGIALRAAGAGAAPCIRRIAAPGVYSTLVVQGADVSFEGIVFDSDQPLKPTGNNKVGIYAINNYGRNLLVRHCVFRNVDDGLHCEPQANGLVVLDCQYTDELRACGVYTASMQNVVILGISAVGSVCEHIVRLEGAHNVLVTGADVNNSDGKETIAIRYAQYVSVTGNTIRAWARVSQGIQAQPGVYCKNVLFASNHFVGLRPDGPWLQVNPGCQTLWADANAFDVDANQGCIAVQAPSTDLKFTGNQLCLVPGATACKPLVRPFGNPVYTETGTVTVAAPAPAVVPAAASDAQK